jgi:hypothetical protein
MLHDTPNSRHEPDARLDLPTNTVASGAPRLADDAEETFPGTPAPEMIHRWLDGEAVSAQELATPDAEKHVTFWASVNAETARRRAMKTPTHVAAYIMSNLSAPVVLDD